MTGLTILGLGKYLPEKVVDNFDFMKIIETSDEWITKRTGVRSRHFSDGEFTWQMGLKAAKEALKDAQISPEQIDMIIVTTVTSDFYYPSMSNVLQGKLGAKNAFGIDISCACAGFVFGLDMAQRYIATDTEVKTVLIVSSENITKTVDYEDRSGCILFGDAAGAAVVQAGGERVFSFLGTEGEGADCIYAYNDMPGSVFSDPEKAEEYQKEFHSEKKKRLYMDGRSTYKFATRVMPLAMENACKKAGITPSDLDWVIPHQANVRIIETSAQNMGVPIEKFYMNIETHGNTSSATIPVCLSEMKEKGLLKKGQKIGIVGFGSGLIYGACVFEY